MPSMTRRTFMMGSAGLAAAHSVYAASPNETLAIAGIGIGGQGRYDLEKLTALGLRVTALCDVDSRMGAKAFEAHPDAKRYKDFRKMFDESVGLRRRCRGDTGSHARGGGVVGDGPRQTRLLREAVDAHGARSADVTRGAPQKQIGNADGEYGAGVGQCAAVEGILVGGGGWSRSRSAHLDGPAGVAASDGAAAGSADGSRYAGLGSLLGHSAGAAVSRNLSSVSMAGLVRLRHRRIGRHRLSPVSSDFLRVGVWNIRCRCTHRRRTCSRKRIPRGRWSITNSRPGAIGRRVR
jgi:hypothetical protein